LDSNSQHFCLNNMQLIRDSLLRQLIWGSLYFLVRDGVMKASTFLHIVANNIIFETDPKLISTVLGRASACIVHFLPNSTRCHNSDRLFDIVYDQIEKATRDDLKLIWKKFTTSFSSSRAKVEVLVNDLNTNRIDFQKDNRWSIVQQACAFGLEGAENLLANEEERDKSHEGVCHAIQCRASFPILSKKEESWDSIMDDKNGLSLYKLTSMMGGFFIWHQKDLANHFIHKFFDESKNVFKKREKEFTKNYFNILFPQYHEDEEILVLLHDLLSKSEEDAVLKRCVLEAIDDFKRSQKCIAKELE